MIDFMKSKEQKSIREKGFVLLELVGVLLILGIIAGAGAYVFVHNKSAESKPAARSTKPVTTADAPTDLTPVKIVTEPYKEPGFGTFYYPEGWLKKDIPGAEVAFENPVPEKAPNGQTFKAWVGVSIASSQNLSESDYVNRLKTQRASLENYHLLSTKNLTTDAGTPFTLLEETYGETGYTLHEYKGVTVQGDKAIVMSAASLDQYWPKYQSAFMQSFVK